MRKTHLLIIVLVSFFSTNLVYSATRVVEIEGMIRGDVRNYIHLIKPGLNFSVYVKVAPRLSAKSRYENEGSLPFFSSETETIQEEPWSNPETPLFKLYAKILKVTIEINFASGVDVKNIKDFELNILRSTGLVPGRDEVKIDFLKQPLISRDFKTVLLSERNISITIMSLVILFLGTIIFVTLNRYLSIRTENDAKNANNQNSDSAANTNLLPHSSGPIMPINGQSSKMGKLSFSDPTRSTELLRDKLKQILHSESFPNLNDMIILFKMLKSNIRSFAFLVYELPTAVQDEIYAKGKTDLWYKGFSEVGEIDPEIFHSIDKMLRSRNYMANKPFEELLIQCWRMDADLGTFLQKIDKQEAMSVLYYLPKNISIKVARDTFPGSWGGLLSDTKIPAMSNFDRLQQLLKLSYEFSPEYTKNSLETYISRQDLLEYLKNSQPHEEEDIYKILGEDSALSKLRPPFFSFFYLENEIRREVFEKIPFDRWGIAIFDINWEFRVKLDEILNEKEKYMLSAYLGQMDASGIDLDSVSIVRETIGREVQIILKRRNDAGKNTDDENDKNENVA
ncbi:MAG: hypothetical protein HN576_01330 [Bacteriovoracaceae bacterium]|jgi:hypothetical protein|nr:hypothetical protein [Bacteriovoracaceae bacterium]